MWQEPFSLQRPECISHHITHYVQNRPGTRPFLGRFGPRLWATRSSTSRIGTKPSRPCSGSISSSGPTDTRFELPDPIPRTNRPVRVHLNTETRRDRNPLLVTFEGHPLIPPQGDILLSILWKLVIKMGIGKDVPAVFIELCYIIKCKFMWVLNLAQVFYIWLWFMNNQRI